MPYLSESQGATERFYQTLKSTPTFLLHWIWPRLGGSVALFYAGDILESTGFSQNSRVFGHFVPTCVYRWMEKTFTTNRIDLGGGYVKMVNCAKQTWENLSKRLKRIVCLGTSFCNGFSLSSQICRFLIKTIWFLLRSIDSYALSVWWNIIIPIAAKQQTK